MLHVPRNVRVHQPQYAYAGNNQGSRLEQFEQRNQSKQSVLS
jgi:hypothetical protein